MRKLVPYLLCIAIEVAIGLTQSGCAESHVRICPPDVYVSEDLEATPRADTNLEQLALEAQPRGRLTAEQAVYDRIVRDVAAARALEPELADVHFRPRDDGHTLQVHPGELALRRYRRGELHDFDCFLAAYGGEIVGEVPFENTVPEDDTILELRFDGIYDTVLLLDQLVGRDAPVQNGVGVSGWFEDRGEAPRPDGPTICLNSNDTTWHYVFVDTDGECEGPCPITTDYYVTSTESGDVTLRGTWVENTSETPPAFVTSFRASNCGRKSAFPPQ